MYIVEGTYPNGERCKPLKYATLDEAMTKLRDLAEADELDAVTGGDGPMFVAYTLRIEPLPGSAPQSPTQNAGTEARSTSARPVPRQPVPWQPRLAGE